MLRAVVASIAFSFCVTALVGNRPHVVDASSSSQEQQQEQQQEYVIVGVSGGLQEGFPEHIRMDYRHGEGEGVEVPAVFLGRALVRGYRSYLDVMEEGWRQYTPEPAQPLINCNVIPTGCYHHANEYWMYLVDTRQFLTILLNEPRFLSIAPDLGLVDLVADETGPVVRHVAEHERERQGKTDGTVAAFPIVTGAWHNPTSHVPSPVLYTKPDGTQVTNFPQSLALWAGVIESCPAGPSNDSESFDFLGAGGPSRTFFDSIRTAIRAAEADREGAASRSSQTGPHSFECDRKARFGVSADVARINYPFSPEEFQSLLSRGGFVVDFKASTVTRAE
jgi:hypothetical protein